MSGAPGEVVELGGVPGLAGLYARGVVRSARVGGGIGRAGRSGGLDDVVVIARDVRADADRMTAYQHLLGESASDALPAGFVHVLAFPVATALMVRPGFPLPLVGLVHLANRIEQRRPVRLADSLTVRAWARDLRPHRSGTQVEIVTEVSADGELAWQGVSTYLAKHRTPSPVPPPDVSDPARAQARARSDTSGGRVPTVPETPTGQWRLGADVGRRYAAVSGDRNPIHLSAPTARMFGFRRAIAHGMYTASRALATIGPARTDAFTWTVAFGSPILLPGTVAVRVTRNNPATDGFGYEGWNARSGKVHLSGTVVPGGRIGG